MDASVQGVLLRKLPFSEAAEQEIDLTTAAHVRRLGRNIRTSESDSQALFCERARSEMKGSAAASA
jgi:hypothetical protein